VSRVGSAAVVERVEGRLRRGLDATAKADVVRKLVARSTLGATSEFFPKGGPCLVWQGPVGTEGRGMVCVVNQMMNVARAAWLSQVGELPTDEKGRPYDVHLLCRNKLCTNVAHFEAIPHAESIRRENAMLTHCPNNHERTPENLVLVKASGGRTAMTCRICRKASWNRYRDKKLAERATEVAA